MYICINEKRHSLLIKHPVAKKKNKMREHYTAKQ